MSRHREPPVPAVRKRDADNDPREHPHARVPDTAVIARSAAGAYRRERSPRRRAPVKGRHGRGDGRADDRVDGIGRAVDLEVRGTERGWPERLRRQPQARIREAPDFPHARQPREETYPASMTRSLRRIAIRSPSAKVAEAFPLLALAGVQQHSALKFVPTCDIPPPFERRHGAVVELGQPRGADWSRWWPG